MSPASAGSSGNTEHFFGIGHSLLALIVGIVGGLISHQLHAKARETTERLPSSAPLDTRNSNDGNMIRP
jgi:hypothetical protein